MDLVERYVHAVRFWLPRAQQDDIAAELSEDIHSQIDEQEVKLGRKLTEAEVESILKERGSPLIVANRYRPQQYLIGPSLFPVYRFVLIIVALCYLVPWLLTWIGLAIFDPHYHVSFGRTFGPLWGTFWVDIFVSFGTVTVVFAILERVKPRFLEKWNPRKLPPVRDPNRIPRFNSSVDLAANLAFAVWWITDMWSTTVFNHDGVRIVFAPVWKIFLWAFLLIAVANILLAIANLMRPYWTWFRASVQLVLTIAGAVAFCAVVKANILAEIIVPNLASSRAAQIVNTINANASKSFPFVLFACIVIVALSGVGRLIRLRTTGSKLIHRVAVIFMVVGLGIHVRAKAQAPPASSAAAFQLPSEAEIHELLIDHVDLQHKSMGTVVGIISPAGRHIISYGTLNQNDPRPLNGDTVFEVGSVTKIFTTLLLSDMVQRGEVALNDPVAKYLPPGTTVPTRGGRQITLADLATHTSGLPFLPSDFPGVNDPAHFGKYMDAVAKYSDDDLYKFLASYQLQNDPGSQWAYSNLGVGLLGEALTRRAGMSYEELVRTRITGPLGMADTSIAVTPQMRIRLAAGHYADLQAAPAWDMPVFAGAGSLRSTANDLLTLLAMFMGYRKSPLSLAAAAMLETRRPGPSFTQALGWWLIPFGANDDRVVLFGGETLGFASTIAYDPKARVGVVVLSNGSPNDGGIGIHLLRPEYPVATASAARALNERKEVALDSAVLDRYVGQYKAAVAGIITIERQGSALVLKSSSAPQGLRLHAKNETNFFVAEIDLSLTFQVDSQGRATALVVRFAGTDTAAPRVNPVAGAN